jgi:hypothetical protein
MRRVLGWGVVLLFVAANLGACASMGGDNASASPSLYKRLGGREGITGVVNDFTANMAADPRVNERFKGMKPEDLAAQRATAVQQHDQFIELIDGGDAEGCAELSIAHWELSRAQIESFVSPASFFVPLGRVPDRIG